MRRARGLVAAALIAVAAIGHSQERPADQTPAARAERASRDGDYLNAAALWRPLALTADGQVRDGRAWQRWSEAEARLTGEPPLRPAATPAPPPTDPDRATIARIERATARDAIAEIVARARRTRIVILNEHHLVPRSRAFATEVARALRPLGYDVLAAETFSNVPEPAKHAELMATLTADGYVRRYTGFYTEEPVFAAFVREALALGYRPVAYEETSHDTHPDQAAEIAAREQAQTDYLMARAVKAYPRSKLLIFVGHGHVAEVPVRRYTDRPLAWMAARLKAASGIDPLTIDQTRFLEPRADPSGIGDAFVRRAKRRSVVLSDRAGPVQVGEFAGAVDVQVAHPRLSPVAGRPGWLAVLGRRRIAVPAAMLPASGRQLVQALPAGAAADAVPIDQVVVEAGRPAPALLLDRRPFVLRYRDPTPTQP